MISTGLLTYKKISDTQHEILFDDNIDEIESDIIKASQQQCIEESHANLVIKDENESLCSCDSLESGIFEEKTQEVKYIASSSKCGYKIIITPV